MDNIARRKRFINYRETQRIRQYKGIVQKVNSKSFIQWRKISG